MQTIRWSAALLILSATLGISACKGVTSSKLSPYASPTPAPAACVNCGQIITQATTVSLSWMAVTGQQSGYVVKMSSDNITWGTVSGVQITPTMTAQNPNVSSVTATFSPTGLIAGHTYYFQVAGQNTNGAATQTGIFANATAVAP